MNKDLTPIELKTQADYDILSQAFNLSRKDMIWPELLAMVGEVSNGAKVLDVGSGQGRLCKLLEEKEVDFSGVDISSKQVEIAKINCSSGRFFQGSMLDLPFDDNTLDVVFHIATLHHVITPLEREMAVREALRVLKPGGKLFLTSMALWKKRYYKLFLNKKEGKKTMPLGDKIHLQLGDIFIPWRWKTDKPVYRYYHAFKKAELKKLFLGQPLSELSVKYVSGNREVPFYKARNLVVRAVKKL